VQLVSRSPADTAIPGHDNRFICGIPDAIRSLGSAWLISLLETTGQACKPDPEKSLAFSVALFLHSIADKKTMKTTIESEPSKEVQLVEHSCGAFLIAKDASHRYSL
jgi:hypothetical protein